MHSCILTRLPLRTIRSIVFSGLFVLVSTSVFSQQIVNDSTRTTHDSIAPCFVMVDSAATIPPNNSSLEKIQYTVYVPQDMAAYWSFAHVSAIYNPVCIMNVNPALFTPVNVLPGAVVTDTVKTTPPLTEFAVGVPAAAPPKSVRMPHGPESAKAAQHFPGIVPEDWRGNELSDRVGAAILFVRSSGVTGDDKRDMLITVNAC